MNRVNGIVLDSAAPLNDGLDKVNVIYYIFGVIGFIIGIMDAGLKEAIAWVFFGFAVAFVVKAVISDICMRKLFFMEFHLPVPDISLPELMGVIVRPLTTLGMTVEMNSDGSPSIIHNGIVYDVVINHGFDTFSLQWSLAGARQIFHYTFIKYYKRAVCSMGLIVFTIQEELSSKNTIA